jgi:hypothetical protein
VPTFIREHGSRVSGDIYTRADLSAKYSQQLVDVDFTTIRETLELMSDYRHRPSLRSGGMMIFATEEFANVLMNDTHEPARRANLAMRTI